MLIGLITFRARQNDTLGPLGVTPAGTREQQDKVRTYAMIGLGLIAVIVAMAMFGVFTINPVALATQMKNVMLGDDACALRRSHDRRATGPRSRSRGS